MDTLLASYQAMEKSLRSSYGRKRSQNIFAMDVFRAISVIETVVRDWQGHIESEENQQRETHLICIHGDIIIEGLREDWARDLGSTIMKVTVAYSLVDYESNYSRC